MKGALLGALPGKSSGFLGGGLVEEHYVDSENLRFGLLKLSLILICFGPEYLIRRYSPVVFRDIRARPHESLIMWSTIPFMYDHIHVSTLSIVRLSGFGALILGISCNIERISSPFMALDSPLFRVPTLQRSTHSDLSQSWD